MCFSYVLLRLFSEKIVVLLSSLLVLNNIYMLGVVNLEDRMLNERQL